MAGNKKDDNKGPTEDKVLDSVELQQKLEAEECKKKLAQCETPESARKEVVGEEEGTPPPRAQEVNITGIPPITLESAAAKPTPDQVLWKVIKSSTEAISFQKYRDFIDTKLNCWEETSIQNEVKKLNKKKPSSTSMPFPFVDSYKRLKVATEVFLMANFGVNVADDLRTEWDKYLGDGKLLPYLAMIYSEKLGKLPLDTTPHEDCHYVLTEKLTQPCLLELIWSYWHEESMLVQSINTISLRFQNKKSRLGQDPLMSLNIDPLRPLNNLLWGHIQDEQHHLSLGRRAYEYQNHYGLPLVGKAVPKGQGVDNRSRFLEAFNNLLYICHIFFQADDDTTVKADGFPVLNALKEVHLILAEGAHNQFGDLPSTARMEMLMQMYLLGRPEMKDFLRGRIMVPYTEAWMEPVDTMKKLQGWTDVSVIHFNKLAKYGEQLLLSIRYGNWNTVDDSNFSVNWVRAWRAEIQTYTNSYRAVTGVDLTTEAASDPRQANSRNMPPAIHLRNRLAAQTRTP